MQFVLVFLLSFLTFAVIVNPVHSSVQCCFAQRCHNHITKWQSIFKFSQCKNHEPLLFLSCGLNSVQKGPKQLNISMCEAWSKCKSTKQTDSRSYLLLISIYFTHTGAWRWIWKMQNILSSKFWSCGAKRLGFSPQEVEWEEINPLFTRPI